MVWLCSGAYPSECYEKSSWQWFGLAGNKLSLYGESEMSNMSGYCFETEGDCEGLFLAPVCEFIRFLVVIF